MYDTVYSTEKNKYKLYEKHSPSQYTRWCIENKVTGCNKCVGYCQYHGHPSFLTQTQRKYHDCIKKDCHYYSSKQKKKKGAGYISAIQEIKLWS